MRYELVPQYCNRKSFYRKAYVEIHKGYYLLTSYDTEICLVNPEKTRYYLYTDWDYSPTTLRHLKEFLQQMGFGRLTKKEISERRYIQ